jgi:hypothetical protein
MANLREIHQQSYSDMPFEDFAKRAHQKFYSDMPFEQFMQRAAPEQRPVINDVMGSDGVSGDSIRAANAGNTRSQMRPQDIEAAYGVAQSRGDKPEQRAMAEAFAQRERADSPIMTGIGDRVRGVARGVPFIGEYLDEATAGAANPLNAKTREMRLDYERARDRTFDEANPYQSLAGKVTGGIAGTLAALPVAGAVTGGNLLLGAGAKSVPGAIGRGITAGTLQGAAGGYGRADETQNANEMAMRDAAIGAAFGGAIPAALSAGKAGFDAVASRVAPSDALSSVPRRARNFFTSQFGDPATVAGLRDQMDNIGPNAVLADVSPEMQMIARGAAARPGSRADIVKALTERDAGKNTRIGSAMNETLGEVVEPSVIRGQIGKAAEELSPEYTAALANAKAVDTGPLAASLDAQIVNARGNVRSALSSVRDMLNVYGTRELDPNPASLLETRKAIDGQINALKGPNGDTAALGALEKARREVDGLLRVAVPGIKTVDAKRAALYRQEEALDDAPSLFQSGQTAARPADVAARVGKASADEALRISQGARAELDRIVGTNANDVSALRNFLKGEGDWNRQKLASIFGDDKASAILKVLDNETKMEGTFRAVVGGSPTAPTQGFREFIDEAGKGVTVPAEASAVGLGIRGAKRLVEVLTGSNNAAKAEKFAGDLGRLSVAGGDEAKAIIEAVMKRQTKAANNIAFNEFAGRAGVGGARMDDNAAAKAALLTALFAREKAKTSSDSQGQSRR